MRKACLFILFISVANATHAQTLSPVAVGKSSGGVCIPSGKSLSYGVNHLSPPSATKTGDSTATPFFGTRGNERLQIYPIPATDNLWLKFQPPGDGTLKAFVSDNSGKEIACFDMNVVATGVINRETDISKLPAGDYILHLVFTPLTGNTVQTFGGKFLVIH